MYYTNSNSNYNHCKCENSRPLFTTYITYQRPESQTFFYKHLDFFKFIYALLVLVCAGYFIFIMNFLITSLYKYLI